MMMLYITLERQKRWVIFHCNDDYDDEDEDDHPDDHDDPDDNNQKHVVFILNCIHDWL